MVCYVAEWFGPDLVLVSAGFDAHADDPLGGMELSAAGFAQLCARVQAVADHHAGGRMVASLEGGYELTALRDRLGLRDEDNVAVHHALDVEADD